jgi:hypothetical protein
MRKEEESGLLRFSELHLRGAGPESRSTRATGGAVRCWQLHIETVTDVEGRYEFSNLPSGVYNLNVSQQGFPASPH